METALRLALMLLVAGAAGPAAAQSLQPGGDPQSIATVRLPEPPSPRHDPALRLLRDDDRLLPSWTLPFGRRADERKRGVTFSVRPGRGLRAGAKVRF